MSHITTHVLDTSLGKPAKGITIHLQELKNEKWSTISSGITNADGRIGDLLEETQLLVPGIYRMLFETGEYYTKQGIKCFYPEVPIVFQTFDQAHYHVPLLLNPFGYSTYRGS